MKDYQDRAAADDGRSIAYDAARIVIEASEVLDQIIRPDEDPDMQREKVLLECGDVLYYLARTLAKIDATFEECAEANIEKLANRAEFGKGQKGLRS